jgi:predicted DNA-binding transcriptional regulator AlpA
MTGNYHLDKRAHDLIARGAPQDPDQLLSTIEVAQWLGCSRQWLELQRMKGGGPQFLRISRRRIRYRRSDVAGWLSQRAHSQTGEYENRTGNTRPTKAKPKARVRITEAKP